MKCNLKSLPVEIHSLQGMESSEFSSLTDGKKLVWRVEGDEVFGNSSVIIIPMLNMAIVLPNNEVDSFIVKEVVHDPLKGGVARDTTSPVVTDIKEFVESNNVCTILRNGVLIEIFYINFFSDKLFNIKYETNSEGKLCISDEYLEDVTKYISSLYFKEGSSKPCQLVNLASIFLNGTESGMFRKLKNKLIVDYELDIIDTVSRDLEGYNFDTNPLSRTDLVVYPYMSEHLRKDMEDAKENIVDVLSTQNIFNI